MMEHDGCVVCMVGEGERMKTMTRTERYNGWANRETWALGLWLGSDEGLYHMAQEAVEPAWDVERPWEAGAAIKQLAETLFTRSGYVEAFGGIWPDALMDAAKDIGSLYRVDYDEVAACFAPEEEG